MGLVLIAGRKLCRASATLNMFGSKAVCLSLFHPCCEPSEVYWCPDTPVNRDVSLSQQHRRGRATGGGGVTDGPQRGAAYILPSPPNENSPHYSQPVVPGRVCLRVCSLPSFACVCGNMHGRRVLATSHLSTMRILARKERAIMEDDATDGILFTCETV